ncbi:MAG: glucosamine-6-phosphate deaminase [Verrucomicrobiales bacterium]|jgi:glucosamine-6-phosphate deaminase|nr:glucosamine-6-phosphate deaminase [Verrucomicrobiales bacterium]
MEIIIQSDPQSASQVGARIIAGLIKKKPDAVLGLATGSTPVLLYRELIRMHREEALDFGRVTVFNLDEYIGLSPEHSASYRHFMYENLFRHVNLNPERTFIPDGMAKDIPRFCLRYEAQIRQAGGMDLQVLGIGTDGHIGFNEPSSSLASRTRIKTLTAETLADNARFFDCPENQPRHVITMGVGTIMEASRVLLLAFGEKKAAAVAEAAEGPVTAMHPASVLQFHPAATFLLDEAAAAGLKKHQYYRWVYDHKPDWQQS